LEDDNELEVRVIGCEDRKWIEPVKDGIQLLAVIGLLKFRFLLPKRLAEDREKWRFFYFWFHKRWILLD
jgi:hypothetical protein